MIKALGTMWRAWAVLLPVVLVNAVLQALLTIGDPVPEASAWFVIATLLSFGILVISYTAIVIAMLQATRGRVSWSTTARSMLALRGRMLLWAAILLAVVVAGILLYVIPGLLVLAAFPYLLVAVADSSPSPIAANFRAIGRHWVRWLVLVVAMGIWCFALWLLTALNTLFISGPISALAAWSVLGLFASWFTCAWARTWAMA